MKNYSPILKFGHSLQNKVMWATDDSLHIKSTDATQMARALGVAYKVGADCYVTLIDNQNGTVTYKFTL